eukprot:GHRQ01027983.1.p1 GENE.GHRQ01027983.1~~GHRQ01027983.1.p1  ORF type:complete len:195 (+),score=45.42 GHRQ01027983.1:680-1264(+)
MCSSCSPQWANLQNFQRPKPCRVLLYTSAAAAAAAAELHPCVYIAAPQGDERVDVPLHLQVSSASTAAQELLEAAGGSVTRVYYTRLGLTALLKVRGSGHCCCSSPARLRSSNLVKAQAHTAVTCRALLGREVRMLVTAAASGGLVAVCSLAYRSAATWLTSHAHRLCRAAATCNNMQAYCSTEHRASAEWPGA